MKPAQKINVHMGHCDKCVCVCVYIGSVTTVQDRCGCVCALPLFSISSASSRISVFMVRVRKLRRRIMSKEEGDGWRRDEGRRRGGGQEGAEL